MNPPEIPEESEDVSADQLKAFRAKAEAYHEWISDPKKAGAKRQLSAIIQPLWQVQDAIRDISDIIAGWVEGFGIWASEDAGRITFSRSHVTEHDLGKQFPERQYSLLRPVAEAGIIYVDDKGILCHSSSANLVR